MVEIENVISQQDIDILRQYQNVIDDRSDVRPDVISKHPRWNIDIWPQDIIEAVLKKIVTENFEVDEIIFNISKIAFRIHVDSGRTEKQRKGKAIIIPLYYHGDASTVFFNNFWNGPSAKFSKGENSPFQYQLPNLHGQFIEVEDIRDLLYLAKTDPTKIIDFEVNDKFICDLEYLCEARSNKKISKVDDRCYDYFNIINYNPEKEFDRKIRDRYLSHVDIESLHGLTIDSIVKWKVGNAIVFDRNQLHSASNTHSEKSFVTIFTNSLD
jgi:hypothetical protein